MILSSRELSKSFLLAFPPPAAAGDLFRQEVLPEEVPCVPLLETTQALLQLYWRLPKPGFPNGGFNNRFCKGPEIAIFTYATSDFSNKMELVQKTCPCDGTDPIKEERQNHQPHGSLTNGGSWQRGMLRLIIFWGA